MLPPGTATRFWSRVTREPGDGCFLWCGGTGGQRGTGYGKLAIDSDGRRRTVSAPRIAWELAFGPIPSGQFICHRCDNRRCVRLDHLFAGTHAQNMADMVAKGRSLRGDLHPARRRPETRPRGENFASSKLTEAAVRAIRAERHAGVSYRKLAERYGTRPSNIEWIVSRRTWKHVS